MENSSDRNPDRLVVVTGASRGLGLAIASALAGQGWAIVGAARSCSESFQQLIEKSGGSVSFRQLDLGDHRSLHSFSASLVADLGVPYGLINNASIAYSGILGTQHESEIESMINVNVTGTIILTKYLSRSMLKCQRGRIVNVSSIVAESGSSGTSVYAATKAAMNGFTRSLARELGRCNITVNAIAPGYMQTDMSSGINDTQLHKIAMRSSLKRLTSVDEVAAAACYLLSDGASAITGTILTVDAGATA
jgi:3-oxoacyl-[acyl-carrier protein] reductase